MNNRTYRYFDGEPLYPFGYGLSYTTLRHSIRKVIQKGTKYSLVEANVDITNAGNRKGDEVVQLYISHPDHKGKKPIRPLRGFTRINLELGEKKNIAFHLKPADLSLFDDDGKQITPSGRVKITIGVNSPVLPVIWMPKQPGQSIKSLQINVSSVIRAQYKLLIIPNF